MKELEVKDNINIELSVKQKKQVERVMIGNIIPYENHTLWQINNKTFEIEKAKFSNTTFYYGMINKKEVVVLDNHTYISALNKKNALIKFRKGFNGSKKIISNPLFI